MTTTTTQATTSATNTKALKLNLKTIEQATEERSAKLNVIIEHSEQLMTNESHSDALKQLSDKVHNAAARKKRLAKFTKMSTKAQSYIFKNSKDHESTILNTSSIYAFDTLLTFVQAVTDKKIVNRECFYVFFSCFAKHSTVSARDIQAMIQRKCISQTTKSNFTAESARTWTRNCFHAMNSLSAMSEEKVSKETFYTIDKDAVFTQDLMKHTALIASLADDVEIDSSDIERA